MRVANFKSRLLAVLLALVLALGYVPSIVFAADDDLGYVDALVYDEGEASNTEVDEHAKSEALEPDAVEMDMPTLHNDTIQEEAISALEASTDLPVAASGDITVFISFEGFNLGHGFYIEPVQLQVPLGSFAGVVSRNLLTDRGHTFASGAMLDAITGFNRNYINPPSYITNTLNPSHADPALPIGNFTFSGEAGWMFTVNHFMAQVGMDELVLNDGDVIRWQFSVEGMGADLGLTVAQGAWGGELYEHADKTELIRALFGPNVSTAARQAALDVIINPLAEAADVANALGILQGTIQPTSTPTPPLPTATPVPQPTATPVPQPTNTPTPLPTPPSPLQDWEIAMNSALANIYSRMTNPGFENEWNVMALARSNFNVSPGFFEGYYNRVVAHMATQPNSSRVSGGQSTNTSRAIIALSSIGRHASNIGGQHNLIGVGGLADLDWANGGTINNPIFALIALDSNMYQLPAPGANITTRDALIDRILSLEIAGGGWALAGTTADPDITSMVLQALTPYRDRPAVATAINRALTLLSTQQTATGGWGSWGNENSQRTSQVIVALTGLGINPATDARFIKNGNNPITALLAYQHADGGFRNTWTQVTNNAGSNPISTEQAALALVAYYRFINGMRHLYDMRDAFEQTQTPQPTPTQVPGVIPTLTPTPTPIATLTPTPTPTPTYTFPRRASISVTDPNATGSQTRVFFSNREFEINPGETAYSLLRRTGLNIQSSGSSEYAGMYVQSINGWGEFSDGPLSGWMFRINGRFPDQSASLHRLNDGDRVEWLFTRDLGNDLNHWFGGETNRPSPAGTTPTPTPSAPTPSPTPSGTTPGDTSDAPLATINNFADQAINARVAEVMTAIPTSNNTNEVALDLTVASVQELASNASSLTIQSDIATIMLDTATLLGLARGRDPGSVVRIVAEQLNSTAELSQSQQAAVGNNLLVRLSIFVGNERIRNFEGDVTVSIPYTPTVSAQDHDLLTVYHLDDNGNIQEMVGAEYLGSQMTFTTRHFSLFFVSEWINPFADVLRGAWHFRSVRFAYSNNLMVGTSANMFSPDMSLTRSMIVTTLWRMEGSPNSTNNNAFSDVRPGQWYSTAVAWASENGIVSGVGNGRFAPTDVATREQFATILYNYAQTKGIDTTANSFISEFTDTYAISPWALNALRWANTNGIMRGRTQSTLVPRGMATRAETATMLRQFIEN